MIQVVKAPMLVIAMAAMLSACQSKTAVSLPAARYKAYITGPESQLNTTISSGIWRYHIQYHPAESIALNERNGLSPEAMKNRIAQLRKTVWFNISISVSGGAQDPLKYHASAAEYDARFAYFLNEAPRNFHLYYGNAGEMKQIGYHFENYFNLKPEITAVVGFAIPDDVPTHDLELVYEDGIFNAGLLKFKLFHAQLAAVPRLAI